MSVLFSIGCYALFASAGAFAIWSLSDSFSKIAQFIEAND